MENNRLITSLFGLFVLFSCKVYEEEKATNLGPIFHARMEGEMLTKTILNNEGAILWLPQDEIKLFYGTNGSSSAKLTSSNTGPSVSAEFLGAPEDVFSSDYVYAIYPFAEETSFSPEAFRVFLPPQQVAIAGSFDKNLFISVAKTRNTNLFFYNVCGGLCFSVVEEGVKSVTLRCDKEIAGHSIVYYDGKLPWISTLEGVAEVTLTAPASESLVPGEKYYIVCYPGVLSGGYSLIFTKTDGSECIKQCKTPVEIKRAIWGVLNDADKNLEYLNIESQRVREKEALITLYNAGEGCNWGDNESRNWCTNLPVSEWEGVQINEKGLITSINIAGFHGAIPDEIGVFSDLQELYLEGQFTGVIPSSLSNLKSLKVLQINRKNLWWVTPSEIGLTGGLDVDWPQLKQLEKMIITGQSISGTIPDSIGELTALTDIDLSTNRLTGSIPSTICNLPNLRTINLQSNLMSGPIPAEIGNLSKLEELNLRGHSNEYESEPEYTNSFSGGLPSSMAELKNLRVLNLAENRFSGMIPDWLWRIPILEILDLGFNYFAGELSSEIRNAQALQYLNLSTNLLSGLIPDELWGVHALAHIDLSNYYTHYGVVIEAEHKNTFTGELSPSIANLTNLYHFSVANNSMYGDIPVSITTLNNLGTLKLSNNNFTGSIPEEIKDLKSLMIFWCQGNRLSGYLSKAFLDVVSYKGMNWVISPQQDGYEFSYNLYESTDYSEHKKIITLQTATKGKGINIVLMGDAFVDTDIQNGTYDTAMRLMYEALFEIEPFLSFRDYFNVYEIVLVSKNGDSHGETALGCYPELLGTPYSSGYSKVTSFVSELLPSINLDDLTVSIATPLASVRGGVCHFFSPLGGSSDGSGLGIAISHYAGTEDQKKDSFKGTVIHEVCGHGFGKLADEYVDGGDESIADDAVIWTINYAHSVGWYPNIDIVSDPTRILWSVFLSIPRYVGEGVGVYEGGNHYAHGVWRSTQTSIMRDTSTDRFFNAPSRESIYKRIHKIAFGDEWEYDFNDFMMWDQQCVNNTPPHTSPARATRQKNTYNQELYDCVTILRR